MVAQKPYLLISFANLKTIHYKTYIGIFGTLLILYNDWPHIFTQYLTLSIHQAKASHIIYTIWQQQTEQLYIKKIIHALNYSAFIYVFPYIIIQTLPLMHLYVQAYFYIVNHKSEEKNRTIWKQQQIITKIHSFFYSSPFRDFFSHENLLSFFQY